MMKRLFLLCSLYVQNEKIKIKYLNFPTVIQHEASTTHRQNYPTKMQANNRGVTGIDPTSKINKLAAEKIDQYADGIKVVLSKRM
jgi:hypothetical protein